VSSANLFLSPHPDDLVYSAFGAVSRLSGKADALVFFNVTRFTKWGLLPKNIVTPVRTVEEAIILARLRLGISFLWMDDYSLRGRAGEKQLSLELIHCRPPLQNLFCPLGIGDQPDHLAVRDLAVRYWRKMSHKPRIWFYEDLPYAARIPRIDEVVENCVRSISQSEGLRASTLQYWPLDSPLFRKKLFFSRLYLSQNDQTELLERHGRELGKKCNSAYAERYLCSGWEK